MLEREEIRHRFFLEISINIAANQRLYLVETADVPAVPAPLLPVLAAGFVAAAWGVIRRRR